MKNVALTTQAFTIVLSALIQLSPLSSQALTLVHTNDVMGELEPCGCRSNPYGGLVRKENLLKKIPDSELLQLDAGNLLFPSLHVPEDLKKQSELQATWLLKGHQILKQNAFVPGDKDFALGVETFKKLTQSTSIQVLSANLVNSKNKKHLFKKSAIFRGKDPEGHSIRVGVIGAYGEHLSLPPPLQALPVIPAVTQEAQALRPKVDILIALTHQGYEKDEALAKAVPQLDLIVGGNSQSFLQTPPKIRNSWILQSSFRNQYVGVLPLRKTLKIENYQLIGLDTSYESPPDAPNRMMDLIRDFKRSIAELNSSEEAKKLAHANLSQTHSNPTFQTFTRCSECHLKQFDFWRKTKHTLAYTVLLKADQARNKECLSCHTVGYAVKTGWTEVDALAEVQKPGEDKTLSLSGQKLSDYLASIHQAADIHTQFTPPIEGAAPTTLVQSLNLVRKAWTPVQCENCHTPGGDHPFSPGYRKTVETDTCLKCHTAERAPEWYAKDGKLDPRIVQSKREQVTCPAGELSETR